jgi:hypothetical protein
LAALQSQGRIASTQSGEQSVLMKEAIVNYFLERELID